MFDKETRGRALGLVASGLSPAEASARMGGHPSGATIARWGSPGGRGGRPRKRTVRLGTYERIASVRRVSSGEPVRAVAGDVGVGAQALRNWVRAAASGAALMTEEEAALRASMRRPEGLPDDPEELRRMVVELQFQVDLRDELIEIVKKDPGADRSTLSNRERAELVGALREAYSLTFLLPRVGVAESTYHYQRARAAEARDRDADIRDEVAGLFSESGRTHGYRRIKAEMDAGGALAGRSEKRVRRVMREEGLEVAYDRRRRERYDSYDRRADEADRDPVPSVPLA
jgi:putative transposase